MSRSKSLTDFLSLSKWHKIINLFEFAKSLSVDSARAEFFFIWVILFFFMMNISETANKNSYIFLAIFKDKERVIKIVK